MTPLRLFVLAVVATALGAGTTTPDGPRGPVAPAATAVVLQLPAAACREPRVPLGVRGADADRLSMAARRLAAAGAQVISVCSPADATAAVIRAAASHRAVLGAGPDVRAALALAAADHPEVRFGPLR